MSNKNIKILFIIYLSCHGWYLFFGNFLFWDDVWLFNVNNLARYHAFDSVGFKYTSLIHNLLNNFHPVVNRTIVFLLIIVQAILLLKILKKYKIFNENISFIIIALFLSSPLNISRINIINFPVQIYVFLFLLAILISTKRFYLSLLIFFISFFYHPLIFLYIVPYIILIKYYYINKPKNIIYFLKVFLLSSLPFIFWIFKLKYLVPKDLELNYNKIYFDLSIISNLFVIFKNFIFIEVNAFLVIFVFITLLSKVPTKCFELRYLNLNISYSWMFFLLTLTPYLLTRKLPIFRDWDTRFQIILIYPLIYFILLLYYKLCNKYKNCYLVLVLSIFISININNYFSYYVEMKKHQALSKYIISNSHDLSNYDVILINDKLPSTFDRHVRIWEYTHQVNEALNSKSKVSLSYSDFHRLKSGHFDKDFGKWLLPNFNHTVNTKYCIIESIGGVSLSKIFYMEPILNYLTKPLR